MATAATETSKNYIGGEWVEASGDETFDTTNPATGETIGTFPRSTEADVDRAVEAAKAAYESWRLTPAPRRGEVLFRVAQRFVERKDELTELMVREMGKVRAEAGGDVQEAIDMTFYMAGEGRRLFGQTTPSEMPDKFQMSIRQPVGVVGAITPWNFPIAIPSWKIAPALVCGNTVVFKPARDTPMLGQRFVEIFEEAGLPAGVLNIVHGGGESVGERLVKHPDVPLISLTGSREVGDQDRRERRSLSEAHPPRAGWQERDHRHGRRRPRPRSRGNPLVRIRDVGPAVHGRQPRHRRHVRVRRARVEARRADREAPPRRRPGGLDGRRSGRQPLRAREDPLYTEVGKGEGATLLTGGEIATENGLDRGSFYRPTIFGDVEPGMRIAQEEIFGPTTALIRATDVDEAIRIANGIEFGLSSSIFTRDVNKAFKAMRDLNAGITYINAGTTGAEVHLPFGGTKGTGNGHREAGRRRSTSTRSGSRSTSTTPASSSARRSTSAARDGDPEVEL